MHYKKAISILSIFLLLLALGILLNYFISKNTNVNSGQFTFPLLIKKHMFFTKKDDIVATKTFSCPGLSGFTFTYPVFKEWQDQPAARITGGTEETCLQYFAFGNKDADPEQIAFPLKVTKKEKTNQNVIYPAPGIEKNQYGVLYVYLTQTPLSPQNDLESLRPGEPYGVFFYGNNFDIEITMKPSPTDDSFPKDVFFKQIADSFQF